MATNEEIMTYQPKGIEPGVYLDLSNEDYHKDPAISSSGIKLLKRSAEAYWHESALNPQREPLEETMALKVGKAYHQLVFEPHHFDYEIKEGVKASSLPGVLGQEQYEEIQAMADRLMRYQTIPLAITNGYPEVSVFWRDEESGLMCRCRFDYWKPGFITDLKTETEIDKTGLKDIFHDFPRYGYDVSGAMYMEGSRQLKKMLKEGTCHVDRGIPKEFIDDYLANDKERFLFLFQEKNPPYEAQGRCMDQSLYESGIDKFRHGLNVYERYSNIFKSDPWVSLEPEIVDITIDDVSSVINYV